MKDGYELAKELFENMRYTNNHDMPIEDIVRCIAFWGFNDGVPKSMYDTIPFVCRAAKDRIHQIVEKALVWDDYREFDDFVKCVNKHRLKGGVDTMSYDKRYCDTCKHNVGYPKSAVCQGCGDFNHYEKGGKTNE